MYDMCIYIENHYHHYSYVIIMYGTISSSICRDRTQFSTDSMAREALHLMQNSKNSYNVIYFCLQTDKTRTIIIQRMFIDCANVYRSLFCSISIFCSVSYEPYRLWHRVHSIRKLELLIGLRTFHACSSV